MCGEGGTICRCFGTYLGCMVRREGVGHGTYVPGVLYSRTLGLRML